MIKRFQPEPKRKCQGCGVEQKKSYIFSELPYCVLCVPDTTPKPKKKQVRRTDDDRLQMDVLMLLEAGHPVTKVAQMLNIGAPRVRMFRDGR